ncbi:MAG: modulated sigma54 specific transcriptional regulator, Fis family [Firmicutes bacterium]|nr:modulated sigma54 specific transcriptional regulator, Fis family [Bacillota bacterium]
MEKLGGKGYINVLQVNDYRNKRCLDTEYSGVKKRWQEIEDSKLKFIQDNVDPRRCNFIDHEVAESWIRSQEMGVNPYTKTIDQRLDGDNVAKIIRSNQHLVDITQELFESLQLNNFERATSITLYLFEKNGILLWYQGEILRFAPECDSLTGLVWSEKTVGTCAHILSMQLKRPVHLLGPEHYCLSFENSSASAAPILDDKGDIVAILVLGQHLNNIPLECFLTLSSDSYVLGLTTALAAAIESKLRLNQSYDYLAVVNNRLKSTDYTLTAMLGTIDEGIVIIDKVGKIVLLNTEGRKILRIGDGVKSKGSIDEFVNRRSRLMSLVLMGEDTEVVETIYNGSDEMSYLVSIRPIRDLGSKEIEGAVLKLGNIEKVSCVAVNKSVGTASFTFEELVGESKVFKQSVALGKKFAVSPENILLTGESGTGKELFAQAIHNRNRSQGPFMAVNCAAVPKELIESELFGYEGGSFTGAERNGKPGKIELAHGGTLFLDEIGDMPMELQAVLLRVLEDKQVMRVGGRRYKRVDFRVVAATNKDLFQMVKENLFREDLYFRLAVLTVTLPTLRQREHDVELLSQYFIRKYCKKVNWSMMEITPAALQILNGYSWPGNVRQLENAIIYAANTAQNQLIEPDNLPPLVTTNCGSMKAEGSGVKDEIYTIETMERVIIENALYKTKNNITKAAELVGLGKSTLYRKLKEYNINVDD